MNKKVLILGIDGYIGWALANELKSQGYEVYGMDNCWRRNTVDSLFPISSVRERKNRLRIYSHNIYTSNALQHITNPRKESEDHIYHVVIDNLHNLGYEPNLDFTSVIRDTLLTLMPYKHLINKDIIYPTTNWR